MWSLFDNYYQMGIFIAPQQYNWIQVWLVALTWISTSTISRVILLLTIVSFKIRPMWWEKINHALYFVIKQTLCSHRYGLQADLVRDVRTVHREELRLKLSPTNIPRRWWIPLSLVEGSGKHHSIDCDIDFFFFFKKKKSKSGLWNHLVYNLRAIWIKVLHNAKLIQSVFRLNVCGQLEVTHLMMFHVFCFINWNTFCALHNTFWTKINLMTISGWVATILADVAWTCVK